MRLLDHDAEIDADTLGPSPPVLAEAGTSPLFLIGERERRLYLLEPRQVEYIEAEGNYVTFHDRTSNYIRRDSIKRLAPLLSAHGFLRIGRSLLVNVRAIRYAEPLGRGAFAFTLACGATIRSSVGYREPLLRVLPLIASSRGSRPLR